MRFLFLIPGFQILLCHKVVQPLKPPGKWDFNGATKFLGNIAAAINVPVR